jgi:hypothetical protein
MEKALNQEGILRLMDKLYGQAVQGVSKISPPIEVLANDYLQKNDDVEKAARAFIKSQIAKCTTSGFLAGLGGLVTLPVAIPANVGNVLYVQMRMIACLAYMGGYNTGSDQVQTLVYVCLAGLSLDELLKKAGIQAGNRLAMAAVRKIPGEALTKINQKVGTRLLTKFGSKGVINLGKAVPLVGGVIGGSLDLAETKIIAHRAYQMFIQGSVEAPGEPAVEIVEEA